MGDAPRELPTSLLQGQGRGTGVGKSPLHLGQSLLCGPCHPQRQGLLKLLLPLMGKWWPWGWVFRHNFL